MGLSRKQVYPDGYRGFESRPLRSLLQNPEHLTVKKPRIISVFGSSFPPAGSPDYEHARSIGACLAHAGYIVMNGGYHGVMAAVSQGAAEAGGQVIGVTCQEIESLGARAPNTFLTECISYQTLDERVHHLIYQADGYVICAGGYGTLHEIATTLEWIRVGKIPRRPIVCHSRFWQSLLTVIAESDYIPEKDRKLVRFVNHDEQMLQYLAET